MRYLTKLLLLLAVILGMSATAFALDKSYYAAHSKLAEGRWVKVKVSTTGIQELSFEALAAFGFNDPSKVKVFGYGGKVLPEILSKDHTDDMNQVATSIIGNKLYFYGVSGRNVTAFNIKTESPRIIPDNNPYSQAGYYFLTDDEGYTALPISVLDNEDNGSTLVENCYDYTGHEVDLLNPGLTGKVFLGENIKGHNPMEIEMPMPGIVDATNMMVCSNIGVVSSSTSYFTMKINGESVNYTANANKISSISSDYQYYIPGVAYTTFTPTPGNLKEDTKVEVGLTSNGTIEAAYLDYVYIRYTRQMGITDKENQARAFVQNYTENTRLSLDNVDENSVLWFVGEESDILTQPVQYKINLEKNESGEATGKGTCTPHLNTKVGKSSDWAKFVIFDPTREQYKAEIVGEIANQDLHGLEVPDMVIITTDALKEKAQIIADYHIKNDNMSVEVIDHQLIFNEFSSGTPDASAYRRLGKMFYDRDSNKFKYVLLFGAGSYDNCGIGDNAASTRLLTYQSEWSQEETRSYTTDDFFTFYDESAYARHSLDKMRVAIGRMPVATPEEAQSAIDKLFEYQNSDNGYWRNRMMIFTDMGEEDLFTYQAEGVQKLVNDSLGLAHHIDKMYTEIFNTYIPETGAYPSEELIASMLKSGNIFATYIGHGSPEFLSKTKHIWSCPSVQKTTYKYLPVFSLATCDVARFDSGSRGIAEQMFHMRHGGAIALLASTRTVYATENDMLNRAFIRALFTPNADGTHRTVGEAVQLAKNSFVKSSLNKLNFILLGDPAMRVKFPENRIAECKIDGTAAGEATILPLTEVVISGVVNNAEGNVDDTFDGTITAAIYDRATKYRDITISNNLPTVSSYIRNEVLGKVTGEVKKGQFELKFTVPASSNGSSDDNTVVLNLYAASDKGEIVNGMASGITFGAYDATKAIADDNAPAIEEMWINSTDFENNSKIAENATLYFRVSDKETGIGTGTLGIGTGVSLVLDEKISLNAAGSFEFNSVTQTGEAEIDLTNYLTEGFHTARLTVSDIKGNHTDKVLGFYFTPKKHTVEIATAEETIRDKANFTITGEGFDSATYTIYVTDQAGKTLWHKAISTPTLEWDMKLANGTRLAPGVYNYYVTAIEGATTAGSAINTMVVMK